VFAALLQSANHVRVFTGVETGVERGVETGERGVETIERGVEDDRSISPQLCKSR